MSSDAKEIETNQAETVGNESVGDKLGYDKEAAELKIGGEVLCYVY